MREEVNTEQGTANKKSEIPSFYEARKKKKESVSDFLCSCSAAVLARSRSHYLCIRKNLSAQRMSRVQHQNSKMENQTTSAPTWKHGSEECTKRSRTSATTRKHRPLRRHVPQARQWGRRLGMEKFGSYEAFIPLALLHDDGEEPTINQDFQGFSREYRWNVTRNYMRLQRKILQDVW